MILLDKLQTNCNLQEILLLNEDIQIEGSWECANCTCKNPRNAIECSACGHFNIQTSNSEDFWSCPVRFRFFFFRVQTFAHITLGMHITKPRRASVLSLQHSEGVKTVNMSCKDIYL